MSNGGIPVVPWSAAFSLQYPPKFPSEPSGTIALYITTVGIFTAGTGESDIGPAGFTTRSSCASSPTSSVSSVEKFT